MLRLHHTWASSQDHGNTSSHNHLKLAAGPESHIASSISRQSCTGPGAIRRTGPVPTAEDVTCPYALVRNLFKMVSFYRIHLHIYIYILGNMSRAKGRSSEMVPPEQSAHSKQGRILSKTVTWAYPGPFKATSCLTRARNTTKLPLPQTLQQFPNPRSTWSLQ